MRELRRWNPVDAEAYEEYGQLMVEMARFIKPILSIVPPDLTGMDPRQLTPLAGLARAFQRLPEKQQAVFVQLMTMSATDFLRQWFKIDPLKATMSASGIIGTYQGVRARARRTCCSTTTWARSTARSGPGASPRAARAGSARRSATPPGPLGAEIRLEAPVARILTRDGKATGVALESGEEILADAVLSSVDARLTFLGLLEPGTLEPSFEDEVRRFKFRGSSGKVNLAVDRLPDFTSLPGVGEHLRGAISFSASVDDMERAYDDAKYGHFSRRPYIDMIIPTLVDPSMAPPGKHVISCFVQYAPYQLDRAWGRGTTSARRSATRSSTGSPRRPRTSATSSSTARC